MEVPGGTVQALNGAVVSMLGARLPRILIVAWALLICNDTFGAEEDLQGLELFAGVALWSLCMNQRGFKVARARNLL
jgi:hypothetical protein